MAKILTFEADRGDYRMKMDGTSIGPSLSLKDAKLVEWWLRLAWKDMSPVIRRWYMKVTE